MKVVRPTLGQAERERLRAIAHSALVGEGPAALEDLEAALDEFIRIALDAADPVGAYTILPILETTGESVVTLAGPVSSPMFASLVESCEEPRSLVFSAVTIGPGFDRESAFPRPLFDRLVLDVVGSVLAEIAADLVETEWKSEPESRGFECGARISPGYCDWPLEGQQVIFNALDAGAIGINLNPSFVMFPIKSVSSVAVVATRVPVTSSCAFCGKDDCEWRRLPAIDNFPTP